MEELFQLAGLNKLAATSTFGLKISSIASESENLSWIANIVGDAEVGVSPKSEGESRKIFIPVLINGFRVAGHLDSGSDVSIMQFSLFLKLRKATETSFDRIKESTVKNLTSLQDILDSRHPPPPFFLGMIC